jgi:hypothetical protein
LFQRVPSSTHCRCGKRILALRVHATSGRSEINAALALQAQPKNPGDMLRTLATPEPIKD